MTFCPVDLMLTHPSFFYVFQYVAEIGHCWFKKKTCALGRHVDVHCKAGDFCSNFNLLYQKIKSYMIKNVLLSDWWPLYVQGPVSYTQKKIFISFYLKQSNCMNYHVFYFNGNILTSCRNDLILGEYVTIHEWIRKRKKMATQIVWQIPCQ